MLKIEYSVVIDRSPAEVFAYVTDIENMPVVVRGEHLAVCTR